MTNRGDAPDDPYEGELDDEMFTQRERRDTDRGWQRPKVLSDFMRRAIENTVGSVQNTGSLSREALQYLLQQGDRGKKEVVRIVAHEVSDFLKNVDISTEVLKVLTNLEIEVKASVKFKTKDGVLQPEITTHKAEVSAKPDSKLDSKLDSEPPMPSPDPPEGPGGE
jgi:hypothetical protein